MRGLWHGSMRGHRADASMIEPSPHDRLIRGDHHPVRGTELEGLRLIGLKACLGVATSSFPARKDATRDPKKLPIFDPIPPKVARMSAGCPGGPVTPGVVAVGGVLGVPSSILLEAGGLARRSFSLRLFSASIRELKSALTPSNVFQNEDDPAAKTDEPAVSAEDRTSRVGASC